MTEIIRLDECTDLDDTSAHKLLDAAAVDVEECAEGVGISLSVLGGEYWRDRPTVRMEVSLAPGARGNIWACRLLRERLMRAFHCKQAGLDEREDVVWLIGIRGES